MLVAAQPCCGQIESYDTSMLSAPNLLIADVESLRVHAESPHAYDKLRCAAILRRLLLDDTPLVHDVNRQFRLKLRYEVCELLDIEAITGRKPSMGFLMAGLSPKIAPQYPRLTLKHDQFLQHPMVFVGEKRITVRDIVQYCANAAGAVHYREHTRGDEEYLKRLNEQFVIMNVPSMISALTHIARVVVDTLTPLSIACLLARVQSGDKSIQPY